MEADLVLTSAGVSRGYYDVVKDILAQEGEVAFWTVRMKPGKPLAFGMLGRGQRRVPHLGLPGNPVSSTVCFELYARPAIYKMMGRTDWERPTVKAIFQDAIKNNDGRRVYARVVVSKHNGRYHARTTGPQGSGILSSMAKANGLAIVPEGTPGVKPGDIAKVILLDWRKES
jgi:molybdopterin molybdotransferase